MRTDIVKNIIWSGVILALLIGILESGWLLYTKPVFKGKVIDAETKQPIEGAVVVVAYYKEVFRLMPGPGNQLIDVKETLTDKEGLFTIPSYATFIDPFSVSDNSDFIIFKPGYGKFFPLNLKPTAEFGLAMLEPFFYSENFGTEQELWLDPDVTDAIAQKKLFKLTFGVVELPRLKTREERIQASPSPVGERRHWKKQKMLIQALRDEWKHLYHEDPKDFYVIEDDQGH